MPFNPETTIPLRRGLLWNGFHVGNASRSTSDVS